MNKDVSNGNGKVKTFGTEIETLRFHSLLDARRKSSKMTKDWPWISSRNGENCYQLTKEPGGKGVWERRYWVCYIEFKVTFKSRYISDCQKKEWDNREREGRKQRERVRRYSFWRKYVQVELTKWQKNKQREG